jgi:hypothetical protein
VFVQPLGEAAGHSAGHVHPLPEPGLLCVHLQGALCSAVPSARQDPPGALFPGCLRRGFPGVWRQQQRQQPGKVLPEVA